MKDSDVSELLTVRSVHLPVDGHLRTSVPQQKSLRTVTEKQNVQNDALKKENQSWQNEISRSNVFSRFVGDGDKFRFPADISVHRDQRVSVWD